MMFEAVRRLYIKTGDKTLVENAVKRGFITDDEAKLILEEK